MNGNIIEFPERFRVAPLGVDDWQIHALKDALHAVLSASTLPEAKKIAGHALVEISDGDAA